MKTKINIKDVTGAMLEYLKSNYERPCLMLSGPVYLECNGVKQTITGKPFKLLGMLCEMEVFINPYLTGKTFEITDAFNYIQLTERYL